MICKECEIEERCEKCGKIIYPDKYPWQFPGNFPYKPNEIWCGSLPDYVKNGSTSKSCCGDKLGL